MTLGGSVVKPSDVPFAQAEIRIIYGIDENGEQIVATTYTADGVDDAVPDFFAGITMLEIAKLDFLHRHKILDMSHKDEDD